MKSGSGYYEALFPLFLGISLALHSALFFCIFRKKSAISGGVYRPLSTIYATLESGGSRSSSHSGKSALKSKVYVIRTRTFVRKRRKISKIKGKTQKRASKVKGTKRSGSGASPGGVILVNPSLRRYYDTIWEKIKENWKIPEYLKGKGYRTIISFTVKRDGSVEGIKVEKGSGNRLFDECALRALKASIPFPSFPKDVKEESIELGVIFKE